MEWILGEFICKQALIKKNGRKPVLSTTALNGHKTEKMFSKKGYYTKSCSHILF
jgi:hypothetical protein